MTKNACGKSRRMWVALSLTLFFFGISPPLAADCWVATSGQTLSPVFDTPQGALDWASALLPCPVTWSYPDNPNSYSTAGSLWWSDGLDHGVVPVAYARLVDTTCRGYVVFASNGSYYSRINNYNIPQIYPQCGAVTCPIAQLPDPIIPLADTEAWTFEQANGNIFDYANLSQSMKDGVLCMEREVPILGGTTNRESGYRPPGYQRHLQEVWDKNVEIDEKFDTLSAAQKQACAALITQARNEMSTHRIRFRPVNGSCHEQKPACAFDMRVTMPSGDRLDASIDFAAGGCGLRRFNFYRDPNHLSGR